jgi:prepilin-type processing-associated H-X9-DG protein
MLDTAFPRVSRLAAASLVLGLLSVLLWGLAGVPALLLGLQGLRAVNASDGRLRGRNLAIAGMVLGACFTALTAAGVAALGLLWVNDKGRQMECADNLRQLGRAINLSATHNNERFPSAAWPQPALPPEQRLSWLAGLLPYLDQKKDGTGRWQPLASELDPQQGWEAPANRSARATPIVRFLCPAHPSLDPLGARGRTHYVGITGIGPNAVWYPRGHPEAGFFGYERLLGKDDLSGGLSYTLTATETTLRNGPWLAADDATLRGLDREVHPLIGPGGQFGGCHAKGLNLLFADGSCRFCNASVDHRAFARLIPLRRDEP